MRLFDYFAFALDDHSLETFTKVDRADIMRLCYAYTSFLRSHLGMADPCASADLSKFIGFHESKNDETDFQVQGHSSLALKLGLVPSGDTPHIHRKRWELAEPIKCTIRDRLRDVVSFFFGIVTVEVPEAMAPTFFPMKFVACFNHLGVKGCTADSCRYEHVQLTQTWYDERLDEVTSQLSTIWQAGPVMFANRSSLHLYVTHVPRFMCMAIG
jgi:hypothetical protein